MLKIPKILGFKVFMHLFIYKNVFRVSLERKLEIISSCV